ncbi:MAG: hypothetical protein Kow002_07270 [Anaerolineales bacterium]
MTEETTATFCYVHPGRETSLRCKVCEQPICASCAVRTPTGYACKDCVRSHQKKFDTAVWYDFIIGFVVAAVLSAVAAFLVTLISGFFYGLLIFVAAPTAGTLIAQVLLVVLRRHRSRPLFLTISAGVIVGALPAIISQVTSLIMLFRFYGMEAFSIWYLLPLFWVIVYLFIVVPVVYSQFSGIRLSK